jgi:hypothetical protein
VLPAVAFRRGLLLGEYALCTECAPLRSCHRDGKRENGLHEDLVSSENLPLRGLYWLSRACLRMRLAFGIRLSHTGRTSMTYGTALSIAT